MPVQPNFLSLYNGNYNVSWMFNSSMDTIHFMVEVRATGWIAFGVATQAPKNMTGYDVAIGGVQGGAGNLQVCWKWEIKDYVDHDLNVLFRPLHYC